MEVTLIAITQPAIKDHRNGQSLTAEQLIVYCARVSNPNNQMNMDSAPRLIAYCIRNKHWSIFEQASMTVEIKTSRAIAQQILRHRSFSFQEFSQRYAVVAAGSEPIELRIKGSTNRQGSLDEVAGPILAEKAQAAVEESQRAYEDLIAGGVAPECARMILPLATKTTIYMTGSVRSWIHYLEQRCSSHAQKEHRLVAEAIRDIFDQQFPATAEALKAP